MSYDRLCSVCDQPMIKGQAFNGLRKAHWDCAPGVVRASDAVTRVLGESPREVTLKAQKVKNRPAARIAEKGPSFAQMSLARRDAEARQVESRPWVTQWRVSENGKTRIGLECPFCIEVVEIYVWSLPNGKRCLCGAMHGRMGSTHWVKDSKSTLSAPGTCSA